MQVKSSRKQGIRFERNINNLFEMLPAAEGPPAPEGLLFFHKFSFHC